MLSAAGCVAPQPQPFVNRENKESTGEIVQEIRIPGLDAAAPSRIETATFALG
jgi:hypothetical protein